MVEKEQMNEMFSFAMYNIVTVLPHFQQHVVTMRGLADCRSTPPRVYQHDVKTEIIIHALAQYTIVVSIRVGWCNSWQFWRRYHHSDHTLLSLTVSFPRCSFSDP